MFIFFTDIADESSRDAQNMPINAGPDMQRAQELFLNGLEAYKAGDHLRAAELFGSAARLDPASATYASYLGLAISQRKSRFAEAKGLCEKAVEMEPFNPELYLNLAEVYRSADIRDKARKIYEDVLKIDPDNSMALMNLGVPAEEAAHDDKGLVKRLLRRWGK